MVQVKPRGLHIIMSPMIVYTNLVSVWIRGRTGWILDP